MDTVKILSILNVVVLNSMGSELSLAVVVSFIASGHSEKMPLRFKVSGLPGGDGCEIFCRECGPDQRKEWLVSWHDSDNNHISTPDPFYRSPEEALAAVKTVYATRRQQKGQ